MAGPFLVIFHLILQAVLAGLFFVMGTQAMVENGFLLKILFFTRDRTLNHGFDPLARLDRKCSALIFVLIELKLFAATFAITQSIAAIAFPVSITILIRVRNFSCPNGSGQRNFAPSTLRLRVRSSWRV